MKFGRVVPRVVGSMIALVGSGHVDAGASLGWATTTTKPCGSEPDETADS